jgi:hypothetical protein
MDHRIAPTAREIISKVEWLEGELSYGRDYGYAFRLARAAEALVAISDYREAGPNIAEIVRRQVRWLADEALPLSESQCLTAATEAAYAVAYNRQVTYANRLFSALEILEGLPASGAFQLEAYTIRLELARAMGVRTRQSR